MYIHFSLEIHKQYTCHKTGPWEEGVEPTICGYTEESTNFAIREIPSADAGSNVLCPPHALILFQGYISLNNNTIAALCMWPSPATQPGF